MKTEEICKKLNISIAVLRIKVRDLGIETVGVGKTQDYSDKDLARIKAGVEFKNYSWTRDLQRFWIWYGFCPNGLKEIKIEL